MFSHENVFENVVCEVAAITNAGLLSIGPLGTNVTEILMKIQNFS